MKRLIRDPNKYLRSAVEFTAIKDINPTRLKLIAAIAIEFTCLENQIDFSLQDLLGLSFDETDVVSRINGFEGKVAIIKSIAKTSATLKGEPATLIASTLGEISVLKTCRDALIHAKVHNPKATMARTSIKQGRAYEVDISVRTLKALNRRILGLQSEMMAATALLSHHYTDVDLEMHDCAEASQITGARYFQQNLRRLRKYHSKRRSLPAIPRLPEQSPSPPQSEG